jgi:hypothetical protein
MGLERRYRNVGEGEIGALSRKPVEVDREVQSDVKEVTGEYIDCCA